jgi:hypothetical protein
MPEQLQIENVRLSAPERRGFTSLTEGEPLEWVDVIAAVRNTAEDRTLFVVSSVRRVQFDAATRTLRLSLAEAPTGTEPLQIRHFVMPGFTAVRPGASEDIRAPVPRILRLMTAMPSQAQGQGYEEIDTTQAERLELTVAFADQPFRPEPGASPEELRRQLAAWGQTTQHTSLVRPEAGQTREQE